MHTSLNWTDVDAEVEPVNPAEAEWVARQRRWTQGSLRFVLPSLFLVYLLYVAQAVGKYNDGTAAVWGYLILLAFAACYLALVREGPEASGTRFWTLYGISAALFVAEVPFAREAAFVMCLYITAVTVSRLGGRSAPIVVALALAALLVPLAIPSWHDNLSDTWGTVTPVAIPIVAVVTLAVKRVFEGNLALAEARTELARLAAENERFRIARDLHDLLGHSLTTITVKAGLARRLGEADPARSQQEIAEVEDLARRSLADVRAAIANYRDVTLAGELATGRELLRAAGIDADLPRAVDAVDASNQELFGWVVREGLTNVVRHAHARSCSVRLSPSCVEIVDDGVGGNGNGASGNGLAGLRERVAAAGGVVDAGPVQPQGWRLRVSLTPEAVA
jgi:two-component system sensor histidine kinase DesK